MAAMFNLTSPGQAYLISKSDPRWNFNTECNVGGFCKPEILDEVEELTDIIKSNGFFRLVTTLDKFKALKKTISLDE